MARRNRLMVWSILGLMACPGCGRNSAPAPATVYTEPLQPAAKPQAATPTKVMPAVASGPIVSPSSVRLSPGDSGYQLLARATGEHGGQVDVTSTVAWKVEPEGIIAVDAGGYVTPLKPGDATVLGGAAPVAVTVEEASARPWDFGSDIVPILTRSGCNTGACHGKADGQNGFHLSLFGYDPKADYETISRGSAGRRLSRVDPEQSLFFGKATGRLPHIGGPRVRPGSEEFRTLLAWIKQGAPESSGTTHGALTKLAVEPSDVRLDEPGAQQVRVVARFADGHERDVTRLAVFRVNDDSTASINSTTGKAKLLRRAEADLVVRYQSHVVSTRLGTIINPDLAFDYANLKRRNFIDDELFKRLESLKVPPSPPASGAAFLRRVALDLTGQQPQPERIRQFLADTDPDKRRKLVDTLLASPDFKSFWKIKFGDLLQITSTRFGNGAAYYHTWLQEELNKNAPWDEMVRTLMTSLGNPNIHDGGPVNYALDGPDAKTQAEQTAQRFMGLRIRCAQCHDHPFDVWTQDDYFGLAAFFAKTQRSVGGMGGRTEIKLNPKGEVEHLRTKKPATPRLLDGSIVVLKDDEDPRKALADWMTAPTNPFFARASANWVWAQFFGKGLADPADDLSKSNPPVHPELLDALAKHFVASKYDLKELIRSVATSEAYALSSATVPGNERDTRFFSHQIPRALTAHQMADALAQATDVPNRFPDKDASKRAIDIADPATASPILDTFGRCPRTVGCSSVATPPLSLRQSLLLIGGDVIESKVSSLNGYLSNLLTLNPAPDEVVENLYMRVVCRPPTAEELSRWSAELKQSTSLREASEDLFWALLNSREFAFNH